MAACCSVLIHFELVTIMRVLFGFYREREYEKVNSTAGYAINFSQLFSG
jgi:hypothetical protein